MAEKKNKSKPYESALSDLGYEGEYARLVRLAVVNGWTRSEFLAHLSATKQFRRQFPGLIVDGHINPGLYANGDLVQAVNNYNTLAEGYRQQAAKIGATAGRKLIGAMIRNDVAVEEYARRLQVEEVIRANPNLKAMIDEQFKLAGKPTLDEQGFRKFIAGTAQAEFYDVYEAGRLRAAGLNISAEEARSLARGFGTEPIDLESVIAAVRQYRGDIGPELERRGITEADIAQLESGQDPKGLTPILQGIIANRRAQGGFVPGSYAQRGTGGGIATLPAEEAASAL